jgi:DNA-binding transcriptional ArsR family regulator
MKLSTVESAVAAARALGHPARLRTVAALRTGELCVCQITEVLKLAPSTVSAHLRELKLAGLTEERKEGRWVHVGLTRNAELLALVAAALAPLKNDGQLAHDAELVEELRALPVENLCRLGYESAVAERDRRDAVRSRSVVLKEGA